MTKKKNLVFGDVVKDPSDDSLYVAVSGATALKDKRQYTLFLRLTDELYCTCSQLFPHNRTVSSNFVYVKNIKEKIENYLNVMEVKYNKGLVKTHAFQVKSPT